MGTRFITILLGLFFVSLVVCDVLFAVRLFKAKKLRKIQSPDFKKSDLVKGRIGFYICTYFIVSIVAILILLVILGAAIMESM